MVQRTLWATRRWRTPMGRSTAPRWAGRISGTSPPRSSTWGCRWTGGLPVRRCRGLGQRRSGSDTDPDSQVTVDEIVAAVSMALRACVSW